MVKRILLLSLTALAVTGLLVFEEREGKKSASGMIVVKIPSSFSEEALRGGETFLKNCSSCHGKHASGKPGMGPPLVHKIYEPSHHNDSSFYRAVELGVKSHHWPFGNMAKITGIARGEVGEIIAYVRELQRANGIH